MQYIVSLKPGVETMQYIVSLNGPAGALDVRVVEAMVDIRAAILDLVASVAFFDAGDSITVREAGVPDLGRPR